MMLHRHFEAKATPPEPIPPEEYKVNAAPPAEIITRPDEKIVVYCGTRNIYFDMVHAAKSCLYNANVDRVFFLIEDDGFPYDLPDEVECVNVAGQTIFPLDGPNANTHWTWMVLMRVALTKIFPNLSKIVSLDMDTIVMENITDMWDIDMGDCFYGAVQEYRSNVRTFGKFYYNSGVMLQNLDLFRQERMDDRVINAVNTQRFDYNEQDALNKNCKGRIYDLPVRYNTGRVCGLVDDPAIIHFVSGGWRTNPKIFGYSHLEYFRNISWDEVIKTRKEKFGR